MPSLITFISKAKAKAKALAKIKAKTKASLTPAKAAAAKRERKLARIIKGVITYKRNIIAKAILASKTVTPKKKGKDILSKIKGFYIEKLATKFNKKESFFIVFLYISSSSIKLSYYNFSSRIF